MTIRITRVDISAAELRQAAAASKDAAVSRRMLAIALILEGKTRAEAATSCGMDRQTLRDWVHRFNAQGIAGLSNKPHGGGAKPCLTAAQKAELATWVQDGPDIEKDGLVRWRLADLAARIKEKFSVSMHVRSVGRLLRDLNFRRISVRPRHPKADPQAQAAHKKTLPAWLRQPSPTTPATNRSSCGGRMKPGWASKAA